MTCRGKRLGLALWNLCILGAFTAGCTSSDYSQRAMRKTVPTIAETIEANTKALKDGAIPVQRGDSLYSLARRHGIPLRGLIDANKLAPPYVIYPGQMLKPPVSHYHVVQKGETMYQISRHYDVDMGALVRINKVEPPYWVTPGQRLRLPDPTLTKVADSGNTTVSERYESTARPEPQLVVARRNALPTIGKAPAPPEKPTWTKPDPVPIKSPPPRTGRKFLWPLRGKVIVSFGPRAGGLHNDGINIAARKGAAIRAAESGVVAYTGNQLQGFGNLVLLKHAGGWMSAYAHSSLILVKRGDIVRRGQVIARVGRTGNVSTPQLHFELRRGERAVNPAYHLVRVASLVPSEPRQYAALFLPLP